MHYKIALELFFLRRSAEALTAADAAIAAAPDDTAAPILRGAVLFDLGRYAEALDALTAALARQPDSAPVLFDRAQVLRRLGRYPEALADFDQALQRAPALPGGREHKAVTLVLAGQHDAALAEFAAAGGEPSARADVWTAAIAWHRGEADRAHRLFERADGKPLGPSSWEAANLRAAVSCALGRAEAAADQLTAAAAAAAPSDQDVVDGLYDLLGDPPLAGIGALRAIAGGA